MAYQPLQAFTCDSEAASVNTAHDLQCKDMLQQAHASQRAVVCLICGAKNTGKSALARHLLNDLLQEQSCSEVAMLDTDLGQPEQGPPGFVSLTYSTEPMLLPAGLSTSAAEHACFVGDVSADAHPELYLRSTAKLLMLHRQRHGGAL